MPKKQKVLMICFAVKLIRTATLWNIDKLRKTDKLAKHIIAGNTCRSPIAEAIFRRYIKEKDLQQYWEVDSAALFGYHEGKGINTSSTKILEKHGITDYSHVARTIKKEDFDTFDWILGMDYNNIQHLSQIQPLGSIAEIDLLGRYDPEGEVVIEDPYLDNNITRFEKAYQQCSRSVPIFIKKFQNTN